MSEEPRLCMSPEDITMDIFMNQRNKHRHNYNTFRYILLKHVDTVPVHEGDIDVFLQLLDRDIIIQEFLKNDICSLLADKYLIAMAFTYFKRAQYSLEEFTRYNFFIALFLAHDIEEDDEEMKYELYIWALGFQWQQHYKNMLARKDALWKVINYRGIVSKACCEKVISLRPDHPVWKRNRAEVHAGANRLYIASSKSVCYSCCKLKTVIETNDFSTTDSDEGFSCSGNSGVSESSADNLKMFTNESSSSEESCT